MPNKKSYKKLKDKNKRLLHEIYLLVRKPETLEAMSVMMKYDLKFGIEDIIWGSIHTTHSEDAVTVYVNGIKRINEKEIRQNTSLD